MYFYFIIHIIICVPDNSLATYSYVINIDNVLNTTIHPSHDFPSAYSMLYGC